MRKFLLGCALFLSGLANAETLRPTTVQDFSKATVKITTVEQRSGGTGSILHSSPSGSIIITNSHVCSILQKEKGYYVVSHKGFHAAEKILKSKTHDLCLVKIAANLEVSLKVSSTSPNFGDPVTVSGHPFLMPLTVTTGYLSESMLVNIMVDLAKCNKKDLQESPMLCYFVGGIPLIKEYNTRTITATIAPGNSGSAVYNSNGEIVGLVFAGTGRGISYGIIVPHEYVVNFLTEELKTSKWELVNKPRKLTEEEATGKRKNLKSLNLNLLNNSKLIYPSVLSDELDYLYSKILECKMEIEQCLDQ